jgi:hypothetical protein
MRHCAFLLLFAASALMAAPPVAVIRAQPSPAKPARTKAARGLRRINPLRLVRRVAAAEVNGAMRLSSWGMPERRADTSQQGGR